MGEQRSTPVRWENSVKEARMKPAAKGGIGTKRKQDSFSSSVTSRYRPVILLPLSSVMPRTNPIQPTPQSFFCSVGQSAQFVGKSRPRTKKDVNTAWLSERRAEQHPKGNAT
jgi:hypothetical protein